MANFCRKCGARLDIATGLCPRCDADKLAKENVGKTAGSNADEPMKTVSAEDTFSGRNEMNRQTQVAEEARENEKRGGQSAGQKNRVLPKVILAMLFVCVLVAGAAGALTYFGVLDIPAVAKLLGKETVSADDAIGSSMNGLTEKFTDREITDADSAVDAAQDVADKLGYDNAFDELELYTESTVGDECFYRLQQYYNGIPVYGRYVTVVASSDGEARSIAADVCDINVDTSAAAELTDAQLAETICAYAKENWGVVYDDMTIPELSDDQFVIYDQSGEARLAYALTVVNGSEYTVVVDANTGEVLESVSSVSDLTGTNADGSQSFPVAYDETSDTYTMGDEERKIYIYNLNKANSDKDGYLDKCSSLKSVGDNIFGNTDEEIEQLPEVAVNLLNNVEKIADYFGTKFEQDIPYGTLLLMYNDSYDWGKNASGGRSTLDDVVEYGRLTVGYKLDCTQTDILAHEYTHIVAREQQVALGDGAISGVISEGLADTFACFYTNYWDIDLTAIGGTHRNAEDPTQYEYPDSIDDKNNTNSDKDHAYATVISHAAYLMSESGEFSGDELPLLWYRTLLRLPYDCSFYDLRYCMVQAAEASGYTKEQQEAVTDAFDEVGIYDSATYQCGNSIALHVYDKQGEYYDDYTVTVTGKTNGGLFGIGSEEYEAQITQQSAEACNIELENGEYTITVVDNANAKTVKSFDVTVKKSYGKTKKKGETNNLYALDFGADYTISQSGTLEILDMNGDALSDSSSVTITAEHGEESYTLSQGEKLDLPENNYYHVTVSQKMETEGITYYMLFTLRVKDGTNESVSVQTGFPSVDEETVPDGLEYTIDTEAQCVTITGYTGAETTLTIPSKIEGYPVTSIGEMAFYDHSSLTSVVLPNSLTTIGDDAFYTCNNLTNITIPDSVTSIGDRAFCWCVKLTNVAIPEAVTSIGSVVFWNCYNLTDISVDENSVMYSSQDGVMFDKSQTTLLACPAGKTGTYAIPNGVTTIEEGAFAGCKSLTDITIPDGVTSIGYGAFSRCSSLTSITIPASVTNIGSSAFYKGYDDEISNLVSITFKGTQPPSLDKYTFESCNALIIYVPALSLDAYEEALAGLLPEGSTIVEENGGTGTGTTARVKSATELYADFLRSVHDNPEDYVKNYTDIEENSFAIADINQDGVDDLLIDFTYTYSADMYMGVWTVDTNTNTVVKYATLNERCEFYSNGVVKDNSSHNHSPGYTIWPYSLYRYEESKGEYVYFAGAYCMDEGYYNNQYYDASNDADGDGVIYVWSDEEGDRYLTLDEYNNLVNQYIPAEAKINLDMQKLTEDNIGRLNES